MSDFNINVNTGNKILDTAINTIYFTLNPVALTLHVLQTLTDNNLKDIFEYPDRFEKQDEFE